MKKSIKKTNSFLNLCYNKKNRKKDFMKYKTMDANEAVSQVAYNFSKICGIYPITPASPMAENIDKLTLTKENYFGSKVSVVEMQSEAGAIALVHGALQAGSLASTFTSSQGLLLMIPTLYKLAGEMLPAVIHVAARSISTHALSIFGDHQDIYSTRMTGTCLLASNNPEESYHLANVAHLSAIKSSLPFIHFFDGFRTSHEINKIKLIDEEKIKKLIDQKSLANFQKKAIDPTNPNTRGTAQNEDIYFQNTEIRNKVYENTITIVENYMNKINKICKTDYKPFNYYGSKNPKHIIIAMGSICDTIKETITYLNQEKNIYGLISVHLYRPFSQNHLLKEIPKSVENVVVLDRTKEPGSCGEPLYLDVSATLKEQQVKIFGGRYGLSSKNTSPKHIKAIFDYLDNNNLKNNFTIGIEDDVTNLSLKPDDNFTIPNKSYECLFYGYGSDGMVSTSKDLLKIIGDNTNNFVQGYFQYDSKKSGGITRSHIRISKDKINSPYYPENIDFIAISKDSYIYKYDLLENVKQNAILLLNTSLNEDQLINTLPNKIKKQLAQKQIKLYIINADKIVNEIGLKNKISTCMEVCIFKLINIINIDKVIKIMKKQNEKRFAHKGENIIKINNNIVTNSTKYLQEIKVKEEWISLEYQDKKLVTNEDYINALKGDKLKVSAFKNNISGIFEGGNTILEKRNISKKIPKWIKENCIQCNQCSFVCPHAVIRPFLTKEDENKLKANLPNNDNLSFQIGISYDDCTGCGLCANNCPGKKGEKALELTDYDKNIYKQENFNKLLKENLNETYNFPIKNVKTIGFAKPKFEFSGACAGCGETPYLKNLTQIIKDELVIANATGCSSIYGASSPSTPYSIAWANSLFEDNCEYGLGIQISYNEKRKDLKNYIQNNKIKSNNNKKLLKHWLENINDYQICKNVYDNIDNTDEYLNQNKKYLLPKKVFIVGGDGFAYDIGFSGLDHVLSTNNNINILVLDTELYSNTGGQSSKSSQIGSIASFTANGKTNYKKDLAKIALCYPHVYVAQTNIGFNKEQYIKVIEEASNYDGPSLIIAYAPCIEHGIKKGMETSLKNSYLATKCGYFLTFRYNPNTKTFTLDSKDIDFDLYDEFLQSQNRYNTDKNKDLLEEQKNFAKEKYNYYKNLEN